MGYVPERAGRIAMELTSLVTTVKIAIIIRHTFIELV